MIDRKRAALLSGLVLPGLGQYLAGRKLKGSAFMAAVLWLLSLLGLRLFLLVYGELFPYLSRFQLPLEALKEVHRRAYLENWWVLALIIIVWVWAALDAWISIQKDERSYPGERSTPRSHIEDGPRGQQR